MSYVHKLPITQALSHKWTRSHISYLLNTLEKTLVELWLSAEVGRESLCELPDPDAPSPVSPSTHDSGYDSRFSICCDKHGIYKYQKSDLKIKFFLEGRRKSLGRFEIWIDSIRDNLFNVKLFVLYWTASLCILWCTIIYRELQAEVLIIIRIDYFYALSKF